MDIIEVIKADHDEIASLIEELEPLAGDDARTSEAMRLAVKLAVVLKTHAKAEEQVLYEVMRTATDELAELALEGPHEHQAIELMLDKLLLLRPGRELKALLRVIEEQFEHHARGKEETEVLPAIEAAFPVDERAQLGEDLLGEKQRVRSAIERQVGAPMRGTMDGRGPNHARGLHIHGHRR